MVLVGNLRDLRLANIIQLNCIEQNVAKLTVTAMNQQGYLYFARGQIVHAEFNPYIGERAVQEMLALEDGQFKVEAGITAPTVTINKPWNSVVLEGLRQIDEKNMKLGPVPKMLISKISEFSFVKSLAVLDYHGRLLEGGKNLSVKPEQVAFLWYKFKKICSLFYADFFNYSYLKVDDRYIFIFELKPNLIVIETTRALPLKKFIKDVGEVFLRVSQK